MAYYILIEKVFERDAAADYRFSSDGREFGMFQINKESGEISLISEMPGDDKHHAFNRAAIKIMRRWKEGDLPERTEWAS